jgi:hypothetical protein
MNIATDSRPIDVISNLIQQVSPVWIGIALVFICLPVILFFKKRADNLLDSRGVSANAKIIRFTLGRAAVVEYTFKEKTYKTTIDIPKDIFPEPTKNSTIDIVLDPHNPKRMRFKTK